MIRKLAWVAVLAAALGAGRIFPFESSDVAQLVPIQALVVSAQDGKVVLDGGPCRGIGADWNSAWQDLQQSAEGHVFLGTADHVVLCGTAVELLPHVVKNKTLRPAASVCVCRDGVPKAEDAAAYLSAHSGGVTLQQVRALQLRTGSVRLPELVHAEGGLRLYGISR